MCLISTVTVLSGATRMKAFGAKLPSAVAAVAAAAIRLPPAKAKPMTRPAPAAAEALRNCRRLAGRARTASDAGAGRWMRFDPMGAGTHDFGRLPACAPATNAVDRKRGGA